MTTRPRQRTVTHAAGVGLVTAIFLLVVLAGLAVAMMSVTTSQQASSAMDEEGARAYQAARAGIEWGVYQVTRNYNCPASSTNLTLSAPTLARFTVTVSCAKTALDASTKNNLAASNVVGTTVTVATTGLLPGMRVWGSNIGTATRIANVVNATTLTLTAPALTDGAQTMSFISTLDRWRVIANACSEPTGGACPNGAPTSKDYVARQLQVDF